MMVHPLPRRRNIALRRAAAACGFVVVGGLALAGPAHADQYEYVSILDNEGVYYSSITDVIDTGKMACRMLRGGADVPAALNYVAGGGYAPYESAVIVTAAALKMCPDVMPVIDEFINGPGHGAVA
ncbi:DUF732 domain-containing protein [Mycobacterium hubeiense]|uniref:DUF732 domain-containing protein n=1 Tax=Mycobacterium hubeiense TaxID=1867256 RepID=UPI001E297067|nr:DUF732 domain-containing protein [Mycobacterium sp. QGD 101]